jgi:hypothetical protein
LLLRCGLHESELHESEKARIRRFLNGLNNDIYDVLADMQYKSLHDLFILACDIENEIKYERQQSIRIEYDVCLPEIEHDDTHIVETSFATNHTEDIEKRDKAPKENKHELASFPCLPQCTYHVNTSNDMSADIIQGKQDVDVLHSTIIQDDCIVGIKKNYVMMFLLFLCHNLRISTDRRT